MCLFNSVRRRQMQNITQLAAVEIETGSLFNTYINPMMPISDEARNMTGIVVNSDLEKMNVHGKEVDAVNIISGLTEFVNWMKKFSNVILVADTVI